VRARADVIELRGDEPLAVERGDCRVGSPDDPVEGPYLAGYSPYHGVHADRSYP
jgi:hypothetical protein